MKLSKPNRPTIVNASLWCFLFFFILQPIGIYLSFDTGPAMAMAGHSASGAGGQHYMGQIASDLLVNFIYVLLIYLIPVILAYKGYRAWQMVLVVFASCHVLFRMFSALADANSPMMSHLLVNMSWVWGVFIISLFMLISVIMLFSQAANQWYKACKAYRIQRKQTKLSIEQPA